MSVRGSVAVLTLLLAVGCGPLPHTVPGAGQTVAPAGSGTEPPRFAIAEAAEGDVNVMLATHTDQAQPWVISVVARPDVAEAVRRIVRQADRQSWPDADYIHSNEYGEMVRSAYYNLMKPFMTDKKGPFFAVMPIRALGQLADIYPVTMEVPDTASAIRIVVEDRTTGGDTTITLSGLTDKMAVLRPRLEQMKRLMASGIDREKAAGQVLQEMVQAGEVTPAPRGERNLTLDPNYALVTMFSHIIDLERQGAAPDKEAAPPAKEKELADKPDLTVIGEL